MNKHDSKTRGIYVYPFVRSSREGSKAGATPRRTSNILVVLRMDTRSSRCRTECRGGSFATGAALWFGLEAALALWWVWCVLWSWHQLPAGRNRQVERVRDVIDERESE